MRWVASALLLASCFFDDLDFRNTMFQCLDGVTCPPGFTCMDRVCRQPMDASIDAPPACGAIALLHDDFDGTAPDPTLWQVSKSGSGSVSESGGDARIALGQGEGSGAYVSVQRANLVNSSIDIEVIGVAAVPAETWFRVAADDSHFLELRQRGGVLYANAGANQLASVGYNNTSQRWWRIRADGTTVYFEVSSDGTNWATPPFATTDLPSFADDVVLQFGASGTNLGSNLEADFDNLNGGGPPGGPCTRG